ncbi:MAG: ISKra4 family transposase [Chloroflexi bacterium]|nr:ISKra4 family transposase [Chloroflexota bacterium]MCI0644531.1 ISKra4 family transposase [Chloroflexota bacterium]MCI0728780.1 ISKra4 family transposase [Chloroflexota bacterium]
MPFEQAAEIVASFSRTQVSEAGARRKTEAAGAVYVQLQKEAVEALEGGRAEANLGPARLVITADGAMVPLVGGEWAEVKTLTIGVPEVAVTASGETVVHTQELSYFSRLAEAEQFIRDALVETERRGLSTAGAVAAVGDGAEWIQGLVDFHRPDALRVLDFPHAAEKVGQVGQLLSDANVPLSEGWLTDERHRLKHEGPATLLDQLRQWRQTHPDLPLEEPFNYLEKRAKLMDYPAFQQAGWPIGSGSGESANKLVVEARLKGAGMHWQRDQVNPMLALRNIVCHHRWDEAWPHIADRLRHDDRQRRRLKQYQRRAAKAPASAAPPPPLTFSSVKVAPAEPALPPSPEKKSSRPAADHPWRRSPIGRARFRSSSPKTVAKI